MSDVLGKMTDEMLVKETSNKLWLQCQISEWKKKNGSGNQNLLDQLEDCESKIELIEEALTACKVKWSKSDVERRAIQLFASLGGYSLTEAARLMSSEPNSGYNISRPPAVNPVLLRSTAAVEPVLLRSTVQAKAISQPVSAKSESIYDRCCQDIEYFAKTVCYIQYRPGLHPDFPDGGTGPCNLAAPQLAVLAVLIDMYFSGVPVRMIILKARQMGITTCLLIFWAWLLLQEPGFSVMVIIDKDDHMTLKKRVLIQWFERAAHLCDEFPVIETSSGKTIILSWPDDGSGSAPKSTMILESAQAPNPGTSEFIRALHATEKTKWPRGKEAKVDASVLPGLPMKPGTVYVDESTAEGINGFFYRWERITSGRERGAIKTRAIFLPWFMSPEYMIDPPSSSYGADGKFIYLNSDDSVCEKDGEGRIIMTEEEYSEKYVLSDSQIYWRRTKISGFSGDIDKFNQEYPTTPAHAWASTVGGKFFHRVDIKRMFSCIPPIIFRGNIACRRPDNNDPHKLRPYTDYDPYFYEDLHGPITINEFPQTGVKYVLGADFAEGKTIVSATGKAEPDSTAMVVKRWDNGRSVCLFHLQQMKPEDAALPMLLMALLYNSAEINGELNACGGTVWSMVKQTYYPNHFLRNGTRPWDERTWTLQVRGNGRNRSLYNLRRSYIVDPARAGFRQSVEEAEDLITNPKNGRVEARAASHDDIPFAESLAWLVIDGEAGVVEERLVEPEAPVEGNPFYEVMQFNGIDLRFLPE